MEDNYWLLNVFFIHIRRCGDINLFLCSGGWNQPDPIIPIIIHLCEIVQYGEIVTVIMSWYVSALLDEITCTKHCFLVIRLLKIIWNRILLNIIPEIKYNCIFQYTLPVRTNWIIKFMDALPLIYFVIFVENLILTVSYFQGSNQHFS